MFIVDGEIQSDHKFKLAHAAHFKDGDTTEALIIFSCSCGMYLMLSLMDSNLVMFHTDMTDMSPEIRDNFKRILKGEENKFSLPVQSNLN